MPRLDAVLVTHRYNDHYSTLLYHWGSVDAPDFAPLNADPDSLPDRVENPERIQVLAPGEPILLRRLTS